MMKRVLIAAALAAMVLQFGPVLAAGPYDGSWAGTLDAASVKCPQGKITMLIAGDKITGSFGLGVASLPFKGAVAADGTVSGSYNYPEHGLTGSLTGKISGGDFAGRFESTYQAAGASCVRNVSAKRS